MTKIFILGRGELKMPILGVKNAKMCPPKCFAPNARKSYLGGSKMPILGAKNAKIWRKKRFLPKCTQKLFGGLSPMTTICKSCILGGQTIYPMLLPIQQPTSASLFCNTGRQFQFDNGLVAICDILGARSIFQFIHVRYTIWTEGKIYLLHHLSAGY